MWNCDKGQKVDQRAAMEGLRWENKQAGKGRQREGWGSREEWLIYKKQKQKQKIPQ